MMATEEDDETVLGLGWLYVMQAGDLLKIGTTWKHPTRRAPELTRRKRVLHTVLWAIRVEEAKQAERHAHELCAAYRVHGEYFRISFDNAMEAVEAAGCADSGPYDEY